MFGREILEDSHPAPTLQSCNLVDTIYRAFEKVIGVGEGGREHAVEGELCPHSALGGSSLYTDAHGHVGNLFLLLMLFTFACSVSSTVIFI